ncbi:MAG: efflux RND transporter periplasmic adaptor subunit [Bacteroidales bacterium]|nr:efflux RND transporter periplasmic adaptor subunit [Bacteroidales bacterium]
MAKSKKKKWIWIVLAVVLVAVIAIGMLSKGGKYVVNVNSSVSEKGKIENTITATGEIQPVYKVTVGTQVSGIVEKLYVDYNSTVKKGDLLAELDKSNLREQVKQSKANLSTAQSSKDLAQKSFDRIKRLYENKAATQEEYDQAATNLQQAKNQLISAQSNYENAVTNLKYAEIYSPIDGVILNKEVEEGQTVAASFSTPTLFTIANNLTEMQVEANIDEADIGQVKEGQRVVFTVDAFPEDQFTGTVQQLRLNPTVTSNVVTYKVIIAAPNEENKLYPGMTANVSIVVNEQEGVLVPLEATYFELTPDICKMLKKEGYTLPEMPEGFAAPKNMPKGFNPPKDMPKDMPKEMPKDMPDGMSGATNTQGSADGKKTVVVLKDKTLSLREVKTGLSDGANVVVSEGLAEGETVVLSASREKLNTKKAKSLFEGPERRKR